MAATIGQIRRRRRSIALWVIPLLLLVRELRDAL